MAWLGFGISLQDAEQAFLSGPHYCFYTLNCFYTMSNVSFFSFLLFNSISVNPGVIIFFIYYFSGGI